MSSRRERDKEQRQKAAKASSTACADRHPDDDVQCFKSKAGHDGQHMAAIPARSGVGMQIVYW